MQDGGQTGAILIGRIPLMLRSDRCVLRGRGEEALARFGALVAACWTLQRLTWHAQNDSSRAVMSVASSSVRLLKLRACCSAGECPLDPGGYFIVRVRDSSQ